MTGHDRTMLAWAGTVFVVAIAIFIVAVVMDIQDVLEARRHRKRIAEGRGLV